VYDKELIAFEGQNCNQFTIDGKTYKFAESPLQKIAFAPAAGENSNEISVLVKGEGNVIIPLTGKFKQKKVSLLNEQGKSTKHVISNNAITFSLDKPLDGKWLTLKLSK